MTTMPWNPFSVCEIPHSGPGSCCGMTKKGEPCKNLIKVGDTKIGHQKLATLAREPFDLSNLQSKLRDVARDFLCARWHRQRQAEQLGQQWYDAAVRNQTQVPHGSRTACSSAVEHSGQRETLSVSQRRTPQSDETDRSSRGLRQDTQGLPTSPEPDLPFNSYVTSTTLRTDSVPWQVSPARPAVLLSATNLQAGFQSLTFQRITPSDEVDSIHCVFCLAEDEEHANESVILCCPQCQTHSHLSCAEEWLDKRDTGFGTSCCVCRNEEAVDALIRPLPAPYSNAETQSVNTASESSPNGGLAAVRMFSANDSQSQSRPQSEGLPAAQWSGLRRSARISGAHPPRVPSTAPVRRSARLTSTQRRR